MSAPSRREALSEYWADMIEEEGFQAQRDGQAPWGNPYLFGTSNQAMWERGWDRANENRGSAWTG